MSLAIDQYINEVLAYAHRPESEVEEIRAEIEDHLEQKATDFEAEGISREDAIYRAIQEHGPARKIGYASRPKFPLIDVRLSGTARGVFAFGPKAVGVFAFGGMACGLFSFGGLATGVVSIGGCAASLLFCWAGVGLSVFSYSGLALGLMAIGGFAVGIMAYGGSAIGLWAKGGATLSYYTPETVPEWFLNIEEYFKGILTAISDFSPLVMILTLGIFVPLISFQLFFTHREKQRLHNAGILLPEE